MKTLITLTLLASFWILIPSISDARDIDRHDRYYGKERDRHVYQVERERDHRHDVRHQRKAWKKHRGDRYWKKHRKHHRVVYRPAPMRVVYRNVVVPAPLPLLSIGLPNVRVHLAW